MTVESKLRILINITLLHTNMYICNHPIVFLMSLNIILSIRMYRLILDTTRRMVRT